MQAALNSVTAAISNYGLNVVGALIVLVLGWMAAKVVRGSVRRALERAQIDATLVPFLTKLVYYLFLTFVLLAVLRLFGVETTSFIAVLGAAGLAVGLALQGTLSNFAAGVMLLVFRPFKVGDFIDAGGTSGSVVEIGVFATTLHSPDNVRVIVPNTRIAAETIKNFSANETRRNDMVIGIGYSDDIGKAMQTINAVLGRDERVLADPAPTVAVSELADSSVNFVVRPWCKREDYWALRFDLIRAFKEGLEAAGCSIPFPQRDVHLHRTDAA